MILRIKEGGNDRALMAVPDIGLDPKLLHSLNQQMIILFIPSAAGWYSPLLFQLLQRLRECQNHMGGRCEPPLAVLFHSLPLVIEIQRKTSCLTFAFY